MTRAQWRKKLRPLAQEAATALVIAIEGDGQRDAKIMRHLTGVVLDFIEKAHTQGWNDGLAEGIEVGQDHW
jgi:hypothetical protein